MKKYETLGGAITRGETYSKLCDLIREAESCCYVMAHLHNTENNEMDHLLAKGWLGMGELFKQVNNRVVQLAMRKLQ